MSKSSAGDGEQPDDGGSEDATPVTPEPTPGGGDVPNIGSGD